MSLICSAAEIVESGLRTVAAGFADMDVHQSTRCTHSRANDYNKEKAEGYVFGPVV